jgi:formylglycine-generating enzyme required for sulfatase activity
MTKAETPVRQARVAGWSWTHTTVVAVAALLVLRSWSLTPAAAAPVQFARSACCGGILVAAGQEDGKRCLKPRSGESFKDCENCPEMVVVPSGKFMMGSPMDEDGRYEGKWPA